MAHCTADEETREMGVKIVHYLGPGILGWDTLCGHIDRVDYRWRLTKSKVNCAGCLSVITHVAAIKSEGK